MGFIALFGGSCRNVWMGLYNRMRPWLEWTDAASPTFSEENNRILEANLCYFEPIRSPYLHTWFTSKQLTPANTTYPDEPNFDTSY